MTLFINLKDMKMQVFLMQSIDKHKGRDIGLYDTVINYGEYKSGFENIIK